MRPRGGGTRNQEESGYRARAVKLAALVDKNRHPHPPGVHHIYKLFLRLRAHRRQSLTGTKPTR